MILLSINNNGLLECIDQSENGVRITMGEASNKEELAVLLKDVREDETFICSSSLDFPHEYTERVEVIELCDMIRRH